MAIQYSDLLESSKTVFEESEGAARNSANRAYYALYHYCLDAAKPFDQVRAGGSHEKIINTLKSCSGKDEIKLGNRLQTLKSVRIRADYHIDASFYFADGKGAIKMAEKAIAQYEESKSTSKQASS